MRSFSTRENTFTIADVNDYKIYAGISTHGEICVLSRESYASGKYHMVVLADITQCNTHSYARRNRNATLAKFFDLHHSLYEFDTLEEFLRWALDQVVKSNPDCDHVLPSQSCKHCQPTRDDSDELPF